MSQHFTSHFVRPAALRNCLSAALVALLLLAATSNLAAHQFFGEGFSLISGTALDGQGVGSTSTEFQLAEWTSNWTPEAGSETIFQVEDGRVVFSDSSTNTYSISRSFDLGSAYVPGQTVYFSAEFTQLTASTNYTSGLRFSDTTGTVAELGLTNNEFFATLGGTTQDTTSNGALSVTVGNPYTLVGRLDFDHTGADERLTMWVNPASPSSSHALQFTGDLGIGRNTLGNSVTFFANSDTNTASFDDLFVADQLTEANKVGFDIGGTAGNLQNGFRAWDRGTNPTSITVDMAADHGWTNPAITATYGLAAAGAGSLTDVSLVGLTGAEVELKSDGVEAAGGVTLSVDGLSQGLYFLKSYHHQSTVAGDFEVLISGGTIQGTIEDLTPTTGNDRPAHMWIPFHTDGTGTVSFSFVPLNSSDVVGLSGFSIVPEPSSYVLMAMAGVPFGLLVLRRRKLAMAKA